MIVMLLNCAPALRQRVRENDVEEGHEDDVADCGHDGEPKVAGPEVVREELEAEDPRDDEQQRREEVVGGEPGWQFNTLYIGYTAIGYGAKSVKGWVLGCPDLPTVNLI